MRARKAAIMLAICALSALTLFVITLPCCSGTARAADIAAVADTLLSYEESVIAGPEGDAFVEVRVVLGRGDFQNLLLPFEFENAVDFNIPAGPARFASGDDGVTAPTIQVLGHRMLNLRCATSAPGDTVLVTAALPGWFAAASQKRPFGETRIDRRFVNTSDFVLRDVIIGLVLPAGMVVHAVQRVIPAYDAKKSPAPPFALSRIDERNLVSLWRHQVAPTDALELGVSIRPERRGPLVWVVGLLLAGLYLVFFRDVLKPREV